MKLSSKILIRIESSTRIRFSNEKDILKKFKNFFGDTPKKITEETFVAPDILMRLYAAFNSCEINDLISISHDEIDYYLDLENTPGDLKQKVTDFHFELKNAYEKFFEVISVSLETEQNEISFHIDVKLRRVHEIYEYPIELVISGVPQKMNIEDFETKFRWLVRKLEIGLNKYLKVSHLKIIEQGFKEKLKQVKPIPLKKDSTTVEITVPKRENCQLFPLYGITLGKTTVSELKKVGKHATNKDDNGDFYNYYIVGHYNFWYGKEFAERMYITRSSKMPSLWRNCGFHWGKSYKDWKSLMEELDFAVTISRKPKTETYNNHRSFNAELKCQKQLNGNKITFYIDFAYSKGTRTNSRDTLYSISVNV